MPASFARAIALLLGEDDPTMAWIFVAGTLGGLWIAAATPVFSQEAYYWLYSENLALSYFDHPPLMAWLNALGTTILGDGALGIRSMSMLCGIGMSVLGLRWLRELGADRAARIAWLVLSWGVPALSAVHWLANPDPPLVFCWLATIVALWRVRQTGARHWWVVSGAAAGAALLSKYPAVFLAVGGVILLAFDPRMRRELRRAGPWVGVLTAALVFSPVVVWNWQHGWASFRYQTANRYAAPEPRFEKLYTSLLEQVGMLTPILAAAVPFAAWWWLKRARQGDVRGVWFLAFALPLPAFMAANSYWLRIKPNWLTPAYLTALFAILLWWRESGVDARWPLLVRATRWFAVAVAIATLGTPIVWFLPRHEGTSWSGWDDIAQRARIAVETLDKEDGREGNVFLFTLSHKDSAQLVRGLRMVQGDATTSFPVFDQNVIAQPGLQFDHLGTLPREMVGRDAILAQTRVDTSEFLMPRVSRRFASIEKVDTIQVRRLGRVVQTVELFACRGYRGPGEQDKDRIRGRRDA